jgi:hypothetical protein
MDSSKSKKTKKIKNDSKIDIKRLDFKDFPPILGQPIILDKYTVFYRAYDKKYQNFERPAFFGEYDTAFRYKTNDRTLSAFITKRKIKLLDIRYVSHIINQLIILRENNKMVDGYKTLALSFGLVSLYEQLKLYKMRYRDILKDDKRYKKMIEYYNHYESSQEKFSWQNPVELSGIRVGETNNDIESTIILKEIFRDYFDGIIFSKTFSPYFEENYIPNEILLFEPEKCVFEGIPNGILNDTSYININDVIKKNGMNVFQVPYLMKNNKYIYYQYGGHSTGKNNPNYIFEKNNVINEYYDTKKEEVKKLQKIGQMFKNELFDTKVSPKINYMNERNDLLASRPNMVFDPSGWK